MAPRESQLPDPVQLTIEALATGGRGVGRHDGKVWFVPHTVPGDRAVASAVRERARFVEATLERIVEPSPARRVAPCEYQARCGGCPWMVLEESSQRHWKVQILRDALRRIGRMADPPIEPIRHDEVLGYRNRVEMTLGRNRKGEPLVGFQSGDGEQLVDIGRCLLQHESSNLILATARRLLLADRKLQTSGMLEAREPARLLLRRSWLTGEALVALRVVGPRFPFQPAFAPQLRAEHPEICGVVALHARAGRRGGVRTVTLAGKPWVNERIGRITFRVPASTFVQVHSPLASSLVGLVEKSIGDPAEHDVLDLYGGVGAYGLALAQAGARVHVVEADRDAIDCGRNAAQRHGLRSVEFHAAEVGGWIAGRNASAPEKIIANPPRCGLGPGVARAIANRHPERVVLVSCDPATLARDLSVLRGSGLRVERITPFDLFPQTPHVETVVLLVRDKDSS